jgi:hypothetical protein
MAGRVDGNVAFETGAASEQGSSHAIRPALRADIRNRHRAPSGCSPGLT